VGQYWKIYNETKKEMLNPWGFDEGAKLKEWPMDGPGGMQTALIVLLLEKSSLGDGSGDWSFEAAPDKLRGFIGWWCGDKVSIVGDYSHLPEFSAEDWGNAYSDISENMVALMKYEPCLAGNTEFFERGDLAEDDLFECASCGEIFDIEDSIKIAEELFCPKCASADTEGPVEDTHVHEL
jgi:hypothetical protein